MVNSNELDRIELSMNELWNLFKWRDNNKVLVHNYKQVIPEGIVDIKGGMTIYFKFIDERVTVYESYTDGEIMCKLKTERLGGHYRVIDKYINQEIVKVFKSFDLTFNEMDLIQDTVTTVSSSLAFIQNFKSEVIERVEPIKMSNTQRRKVEWHNRHDSNKVIKLQRIIYKIPDGARHTNTDRLPRQITRHTGSWGVRGHERKLKSGKVIFIRAYVKGKGVRQGKIYKMEGV